MSKINKVIKEDTEVYNLQRFLMRSRTTTSKLYEKCKTD